MSLPRDLQVDIPGHGTGKLNAAYSARRLESADQDDPAERVPAVRAQPHPRRQLRRLRGSGRRDRLRLLRHRPPLLQRVLGDRHRRQLLVDQHRARLPAAVRRQQPAERGAGVRALSSHRHRPGPRGTSAGLHPLGQEPVLDRQADLQSRSSAQDPRPALPVRRGVAQHRRAAEAVRPRREHGVQPRLDQADPVPGDPATVHPDRVLRDLDPGAGAGDLGRVRPRHAGQALPARAGQDRRTSTGARAGAVDRGADRRRVRRPRAGTGAPRTPGCRSTSRGW